MKTINIKFAVFLLALLFNACGGKTEEPDAHVNDGAEEASTDVVHLVQEQMDVMGIKVGNFQEVNLNTTIKSNGYLELPPQNKASVSALMDGRVKTINVVEGEYVKKGQVLARLEHPAYLEMQEKYLEEKVGFKFLEQDYFRKKGLLADSITSLKIFQETEAKYNSSNMKLSTMKAKLQLIGIDVNGLENGTVFSSIPIISPINGYVRLVEVNMGMSVEPKQEMFEIVDNEHIHIDLRVYEKDIDKVKEGQKVHFSLTTQPDKVFEGKVFAIGKAFENDPKAVIVHAEIENKTGNLLPGMYVDARVETDRHKVRALPYEAIVEDGGLSYIFVQVANEEGQNHAEEEGMDEHEHEDSHGNGHDGGHGHDKDGEDDHDNEFLFRKIEVNTGAKDIGFTEVVPAQRIPENPIIVTKGAYYLLAELKKGEGGEEHHH